MGAAMSTQCFPGQNWMVTGKKEMAAIAGRETGPFCQQRRESRLGGKEGGTRVAGEGDRPA